ncbi:hypothetical protein K435DRAFT_779706 [Dendrothele bispora CBS 962.96]|uniref:Fungal N-terminal domain-containing protein n=1 Tax=Dendrothele bispora (strain CBS 962.96) TaxID=1314807 RepID=A0A4V4HF77_DENBC|nr:hypothetical protein K435DRAFT_779706 [Dendrothele bispora CBS 962.96]
MPKRSSNTGKRFYNALDVSTALISTLHEVARFSPVPFLAETSSLALNLLNIVQNAKNNQEDFLRLAKEACELVYGIKMTLGNTRNPNVDLRNYLKVLKETLSEIEDYAKRRTSRNWAARAIFTKSDAMVVQEYRQQIRHALDLFNIQTTVTNTDTINGMANDLQYLRNDVLQYQGTSSPPSPSVSFFSGSNINFRGGSFNNVQGNFHSESRIDRSQRVNSGNIYYVGTSGPSRLYP